MFSLLPDYIYTPQGIKANQVITVTDDGRIDTVVPSEQVTPSFTERMERLPGALLLPGFVNTHSHVFQSVLRGHTQRPLSNQDSFWTWRRAMYEAAGQLTPDSLYQQALHTYREMLDVGYTTVGEFHYVHHQTNGQPYANPNTMAEAVLCAAKNAGIRVVLLLTAYAQGGINRPPEEAQRRFCDASVDHYLERVELLRNKGVSVGVAPHSIRAVPESWLRPIADYSRTNGLPLHIHADEQRAEIEQCQEAYGCTPIALLERCGVLHPLTTIVHATHANDHEVALLQRFHTTVCVCPTTEGDLGDGIAPYKDLVQAQIPLAIGADSNTRLDPIEELRWSEYTARMRYEGRRILIDEPLASPGSFLLAMGTRNGAQALGQQTGELAPGMLADFVAIDLNHPSLQGWTTTDLLDGIFFGASAAIIKQVWVQGKKVH